MVNNKDVTPSEQALLAEYSAANDAYMHYDNYSWGIGSVLIAGSFVYWGFLLSQSGKPDPVLYIISSILVTLIMSIWILYANHLRQLYLSKLHRLHEIELLLGMKQHIRWMKTYDKGAVGYRTFGPKGHVLDVLIYLIASLGTPVISYLKIGLNSWLLIPLVLVIFSFSATIIYEKQLKAHLEKVK